MITIFTTTKPFAGHISIIQKNAIQSWKMCSGGAEILVFDNEEGTAEACKELGVRHVPEVKKNKYGTPFISDIFEQAQNFSVNNVLAYVNADIMLTSDFPKTISRVNFPNFLMVGRRIDLDITERVDFGNPNWEGTIREKVQRKGRLHGYSGIDYFVFTKDIWQGIPPLVIGRTSWDNWLLYKAVSRGIPLIDATQSITAIHQNHARYIPANKKTNVWKGPEAKENKALVGGEAHLFSIRDADFVLTEHGIQKQDMTIYRIVSFAFRNFERSSFLLKLFLLPGMIAMVLVRKIRRKLA